MRSGFQFRSTARRAALRVRRFSGADRSPVLSRRTCLSTRLLAPSVCFRRTTARQRFDVGGSGEVGRRRKRPSSAAGAAELAVHPWSLCASSPTQGGPYRSARVCARPRPLLLLPAAVRFPLARLSAFDARHRTAPIALRVPTIVSDSVAEHPDGQAMATLRPGASRGTSPALSSGKGTPSPQTRSKGTMTPREALEATQEKDTSKGKHLRGTGRYFQPPRTLIPSPPPLATLHLVRTVVVRFKATGNAPIMKQNFYKITASNQFRTVTAFLRKELGWKPSDPLVRLALLYTACRERGFTHCRAPPACSQFVYINSAFAPALDDTVANLYKVGAASPCCAPFPRSRTSCAQKASDTDAPSPL